MVMSQVRIIKLKEKTYKCEFYNGFVNDYLYLSEILRWSGEFEESLLLLSDCLSHLNALKKYQDKTILPDENEDFN